MQIEHFLLDLNRKKKKTMTREERIKKWEILQLTFI